MATGSSAEASATGSGVAPAAGKSSAEMIRPVNPPSRNSAARAASANTISAPISSTIAHSSAGEPRLLISAATPPHRITARKPSIHSAQLRMQIATRSPRAIPSSAARASRRVNVSAKLNRRAPSTMKVFSPCARALSISMFKSGGALKKQRIPSRSPISNGVPGAVTAAKIGSIWVINRRQLDSSAADCPACPGRKAVPSRDP